MYYRTDPVIYEVEDEVYVQQEHVETTNPEAPAVNKPEHGETSNPKTPAINKKPG